MSTINSLHTDFAQAELRRYSYDLKQDFNLISVAHWIFTFGLYTFLTKKCWGFFFSLFEKKEEIETATSSAISSASTSVEAVAETTNVDGFVFLLAILVFIGFIALMFYCPFKVTTMIIQDIIPMQKTYSFNRKLPVTRLKYRQIKALSNELDDFHIWHYLYFTRNIDRYGFDYKGEDICGTWYSYFVLMCAQYHYNFNKKISNLCSVFGLIHFSNTKEKNSFNNQVNKHTEKVVSDILKDIEKVKKKAEIEINTANEMMKNIKE